MGVYARDHAHQLLLDTAEHGERSHLSPRAMLLLFHIASRFGGDQDKANEDITKGKLWNREAVYLEGLGKKARAIGYNVPEKINAATIEDGELTKAQERAAKAAVGKAIKELLDAGLLVKTRRGQTGQTPTYKLAFLSMGCSRCLWTKDDGQLAMDETRHLSPEQLEQRHSNLDEYRIQQARNARTPAPKPKAAASDPWGASIDLPWESKPQTDDGWGAGPSASTKAPFSTKGEGTWGKKSEDW